MAALGGGRSASVSRSPRGQICMLRWVVVFGSRRVPNGVAPESGTGRPRLCAGDHGEPATNVVPDGRCGVALVDGVTWWLGPETKPWLPPRRGVHVVGVRLSLTAGRRAVDGPLEQFGTPMWRSARCGVTRWSTRSRHRLRVRVATSSGSGYCSRRYVGVLPQRDPLTISPSLWPSRCSWTSRSPNLPGKSGCHRDRCTVAVLTSSASPLLCCAARVQRAAGRSVETDRSSLAQLAADTGFTDPAHLCREIRAMSAATPRAVFG